MPSLTDDRLATGTWIDGYVVGPVVDRDELSISYSAQDPRLGSTVLIVECFPTKLALRGEGFALCARSPGDEAVLRATIDSFESGVRELARVRHPALTTVTRLIARNNTCYAVVADVPGITLEHWTRERAASAKAEVGTVIEPMLDALQALHEGRFVVRLISPGSVKIGPDDRPVLTGLPRCIDCEDHWSSGQVIPRTQLPYVAPEIESGDQVGPWTDIYAVAATVYWMITGEPPARARDRLAHDTYEPVAVLGRGRFSPSFLDAIDLAMNLDPGRRPQTIAAWRKLLHLSGVRQVPLGEPRATQPATVQAKRRGSLALDERTMVAPTDYGVQSSVETVAAPMKKGLGAPVMWAVVVVLVALAGYLTAGALGLLARAPESDRSTEQRAEPASPEGAAAMVAAAPVDPVAGPWLDKAASFASAGDELAALEALEEAARSVPANAAIADAIAKLAGTEAAPELSGLGGQVTDLRFFETGKDRLPTLDERSYRKRFARDSARALAFEVTLSLPPPTAVVPYVVGAAWYRDGMLDAAQRATSQIPAGAIGTRYVGSLGWEGKGNWQAGAYRVDVYVNGKKVATGGFEVG